MPYGLPKSIPASTRYRLDKKIERCVKELMKRGYSKVSAIRICKSSVLKGYRKRKKRKEKKKEITNLTL